MSSSTKIKACVFLFLMVIVFSCKQIRKVADVIVQPTARELYAREFENLDSLRYSSWKLAFKNAKDDSLQIRLPYSEHGEYYKERITVYSYTVFLNEGEIFNVAIENKVLGIRNFINLIKVNPDNSLTDIFQNELAENEVKIPIDETGIYKITIQPELDSQGAFTFQMYTSPSFGFPVLGKDNNAIQSYWGAVRDGGARSHEGIDIFAPRGTPVVAAVEGMVSSTGERGLGGKQVWLRTGLFGKSLYYAHLDSILVSTGNKVTIGDTLGLVGNTGNARTTAPHLHFGIYKSGQGAINPLPFVKLTEKPDVQRLISTSRFLKVSSAVANIRNAPEVAGIKLGEVKRNDTLSLLGYTENWAHIKLPSGNKAFIYKSLVSEL
ncbi:M23 family metallopeptidase [Maribacter forsetii]|uniref:M23 family metallopeptidase n=1 Tax=Maribacter forsetii TaxID=444515 RepID=UPI00056093C1|nr:M23 family metallopeptidase [Maribacter forsetii]